METSAISLQRYITPAVPAFVVSCAAAMASWVRSTAKRSDVEAVKKALDDALAPIHVKLDKQTEAIVALDRSIAVQEARHDALVTRVELNERRATK